MRATLSIRCLGLVLAAGSALAANRAIPVNILPACNFDFYISAGEANESKRYAATLGYTNELGEAYYGSVRVPIVFGHHTARDWRYGQHTYSWNFQSTGKVALPDDGVLATEAWRYQLITTLDNPPEGGFGLPTFPLPVAKADIHLPLATNAWSFSAASANLSADILFPTDQQGPFASVNLIFVSAGFGWKVSALYADAGVVEIGSIKSAAPDKELADFDGFAANENLLQCNRAWSLTGSGYTQYSDNRDNLAYVRHLRDGLPLDHQRVLTGLRFTSLNSKSQIVVMAVSVQPYVTPATLLLVH